MEWILVVPKFGYLIGYLWGWRGRLPNARRRVVGARTAMAIGFVKQMGWWSFEDSAKQKTGRERRPKWEDRWTIAILKMAGEDALVFRQS